MISVNGGRARKSTVVVCGCGRYMCTVVARLFGVAIVLHKYAGDVKDEG